MSRPAPLSGQPVPYWPVYCGPAAETAVPGEAPISRWLTPAGEAVLEAEDEADPAAWGFPEGRYWPALSIADEPVPYAVTRAGQAAAGHEADTEREAEAG